VSTILTNVPEKPHVFFEKLHSNKNTDSSQKAKQPRKKMMQRAVETTNNCNIKRQGTMISNVELPNAIHVEGKLWPRILVRETTKKDFLRRPNHQKSVPVKRRQHQQVKVKERMKKPTMSLPIIEYSSPLPYGCFSPLSTASCPSSSPACDVPSLVLESENWKRATLHGRSVVVAGKKWTRIVPFQQARKQVPCLITRIRAQPPSMVN
jgi:hypothetical protein